MAAKKKSSRADKMVSDAKKKGASGTSGNAVSEKKAASAKKAAEKKPPKVKTEYEANVSNNFVAAVACIFLCALFGIMAFNSEGALLRIAKSAVLGLIGQAAFYFSIPALFYLFIIHAFNKKKRLKLRTFCLLSFVFLCGCIFHMIVYAPVVTEGFQVIAELYRTGATGRSGGVFCGGITLLLHWPAARR